MLRTTANVYRRYFLIATCAVVSPLCLWSTSPVPQFAAQTSADPTYSKIEKILEPLAKKLEKPQPGDWLAIYKEPGQTFDQYVAGKPVRKSDRLNAIYVCSFGELTAGQKRVLEITRDYMAVFFQVPIKQKPEIPLERIKKSAKRVNPNSGQDQILADHVLHDLLKPEYPRDALAYVAFTPIDLWAVDMKNFVFGLASYQDRTGVWSISRHGDPDKNEESFRLCLRRTMGTATHETGHALGMYHCIKNQCCMNGSNSLEEADRQPLHLCPVCLRKLFWNLQVEPIAYLQAMEKFCREHKLDEEVTWYGDATKALRGK